MREINIASITNVELWPGRRIYTGAFLGTLPKGAMSLIKGSGLARLSFGSANRSTMSVIGTHEQVDALWTAIVEAERPSEGVVTLK